MRLICISGQANSGKDTVANHFVSTYGFVKIALADPLKRWAMDVFGFSEDQLWGSSEKRNEPDKRFPKNVVTNHSVPGDSLATECRLSQGYLSPRETLLNLGDATRKCYRDAVTNYCLNIIDSIPIGDYTNVYYSKQCGVFTRDKLHLMNGIVISDARRKNEFEKIRKRGGILIRVKRNSLPHQKLGAANHPTETEQVDIPDSYFDFVIKNDSSLMNLFSQVDNIMEKIKNE
jgi:hypothetical protein